MNPVAASSYGIRTVSGNIQDVLNVPLSINAVNMHDQMNGRTNLRIGLRG